MTEQQKAEAYVREKLPELMELSFGCEVRWNGRPYTVQGIGGVSANSELDKGYIQITNHTPYGEAYPHKLDVEIIGHPIQLHHWLECLRQKLGRRVYMSLHTLEVEDSGFYMQFDKDTGQPATESDYRSFNEIVGNT